MRLALITGGSNGLGLSLCELLSAGGYRVVEFSRRAPHPFSIHIDLSSPRESYAIIASAMAAVLNTNFTSAIVILSAIMQRFQTTECRKVVANISSGAAQKGYAGWSLYCAAKAGMENFVRAVAMEQKMEPHPIIPINIDPGVMDTNMQALIRAASIADFPELNRFIKRKEQGALASPEKVAAAVLRILALPSLAYGARYDVASHWE